MTPAQIMQSIRLAFTAQVEPFACFLLQARKELMPGDYNRRLPEYPGAMNEALMSIYAGLDEFHKGTPAPQLIGVAA